MGEALLLDLSLQLAPVVNPLQINVLYRPFGPIQNAEYQHALPP